MIICCQTHGIIRIPNEEYYEGMECPICEELRKDLDPVQRAEKIWAIIVGSAVCWTVLYLGWMVLNQ